MRYLTVTEIENLCNIDQTRKTLRTLWYDLAEGFEMVPSTYQDYCLMVERIEGFYLTNWKLDLFNDGSVSAYKFINYGKIIVRLNKNGKESIEILPA